MNDKRVKMGMGLLLCLLGIWGLAGGAAASPVALLPEVLKVPVAVLAIVFGYLLYRSACPT